MLGREAIRRYWQEGAGESQREVRFDFKVLWVGENMGAAHWRATFVRIPSGSRVELDGVLLAEFSASGRCSLFREWWHRREEQSAG